MAGSAPEKLTPRQEWHDLLACPTCRQALSLTVPFMCPTCGREYAETEGGLVLTLDPDRARQSFGLTDVNLEWVPGPELALTSIEQEYTSMKNEDIDRTVRSLWERTQKPLDVCDIGCGDPLKPGSYMASVWPYTDRYVGVDPSRPRLQGLSCTSSRGLATGIGEELPVLSGSFDLCFLMSALAHCREPSQVLDEAYRILRPGGSLCIFVANHGSWMRRVLRGKADRRRAALRELQPSSFTGSSLPVVVARSGLTVASLHSTMYVRLPAQVARVLGRLDPRSLRSLLSMADRIGRKLFPLSGDRLLLWATKPLTEDLGRSEAPTA